MRLVKPEVMGNNNKGYKTSRYELLLELFDPKFFTHPEEEFLLPHYSLTRDQWGMSSLRMKIVIKIEDGNIKLDEDVQTQRDRSFELFPLGLQKSERSETSSQSYEVEYSFMEHFSIRYARISGRRHIERRGRIIPSEVQPFLLA